MRVWMRGCGILYGTYVYLEITLLKLFVIVCEHTMTRHATASLVLNMFRRNCLPTDSDKQVSHRSSGSDGDSDMACTRDF